MLNKIKKKLTDVYFVRFIAVVISCLAILLLAIALVFISINNRTNDSIIMNAEETQTGNKIEHTLSIIKDESLEDQQYDSIKTQMFTVVNKNTNEVASISDGIIAVENVKSTLEEYLNQNKYKVMSIGVINNKFYIQQDVSKPIDYNIKVGIVSLADSFSADDWIKLTEAVYSKVDVDADSLISVQMDTGNKHFIYVYSDKLEVDSVEN